MKQFFTVGFLVCLTLSVAGAQETTTGKPPQYPPSVTPDRVLLTWKSDPATTQSVCWRTSTEVTAAKAEIAKAGDGPDFVKSATAVDAVTSPLTVNDVSAHFHSTTFVGLEPATLYAYRVGDGEHWSEWYQFRTASRDPAPMQFIYVGDAQTDLKSHWSRVIREAYTHAPRSRFILHAGDLINRGDADEEWGEWFHSLGWISGSVSHLAIPGNHEYSRLLKIGPKSLSPYWRPQFALPENGPIDLEEAAWYVDLQGVRMIGLNSNEEQPLQKEWLEHVLKNNPNRWTIITHHHPIHSTGQDRDNAFLRRMWQPVYDKYGVDLVLQGHDHTYGRTRPITTTPEDLAAAEGEAERSAKPAETQNVATGVRGRTPGGTVYVVSVSGPKQYSLKDYPESENPFDRRAANTQLFQIITIDGDTLRYEARTATGELYDEFQLTKQSEGSNRFESRIPEKAERLAEPVKN